MATQIYGDISSAWKKISTDDVGIIFYHAKNVFDDQRYMHLWADLK